MTCDKLIDENRLPKDVKAAHVDFNRLFLLHRDGRRLITGWLDKAERARDPFERFIYAWIAFNGWAACVTEFDVDFKWRFTLMRDTELQETFQVLVEVPESALGTRATRFAEFWPIFKVQELREMDLLRHGLKDRAAIIDRYLGHGATQFEPRCWNEHRMNGEPTPVDWPHTLSALNRVRCNLFHGEKAAHSEMDRQIVTAAYETLSTFIQDAELFDYQPYRQLPLR